MNRKFFWGGQPGSEGKFNVCGGAPPPPIESPLIVMNVNGYNIQQLFPSVYSQFIHRSSTVDMTRKLLSRKHRPLMIALGWGTEMVD